jgi:SAM-dependent methyltransferase
MAEQPPRLDSGLIEDLPSRELLRGIFHLLFGREPDVSDSGAYVRELESGELSPRQLTEWLVHSAEWSHGTPMTEFGPSLHYGRGIFIRSLPRARRILDIGGAAVGDPSGGLVLMGYPYGFDELVIVDLPNEERHSLYRDEARPKCVETERGRVTYRYHSMTALSDLPSASFDLVYSGQSIEHVTRREADGVLSQVRRVLKPGGVLALDTPNSRLTRLQQDAFVDPDHKYEYSHAEMAVMLRGNGFVVERAVGIGYGGDSLAQGVFDTVELATKRGLYDEIADCYLLAYVCRRPARLGTRTAYDRARWRLTGPTSLLGRALGRARRLVRSRSAILSARAPRRWRTPRPPSVSSRAVEA